MLVYIERSENQTFSHPMSTLSWSNVLHTHTRTTTTTA